MHFRRGADCGVCVRLGRLRSSSSIGVLLVTFTSCGTTTDAGSGAVPLATATTSGMPASGAVEPGVVPSAGGADMDQAVPGTPTVSTPSPSAPGTAGGSGTSPAVGSTSLPVDETPVPTASSSLEPPDTEPPPAVDTVPVATTAEPPVDLPDPSEAEPPAGSGFYRLEALDRGLVAVPHDDGVYVGFRMLGTEYVAGDAASVSYQLFRDDEAIATLTDSTNYLDVDGSSSSTYSVVPSVLGQALPRSERVGVWAQEYLRVPLESPGGGYSANDASAADLDGDGSYELVLKWDPDNAKDNAHDGVTGDVYLDALELDGTRSWRINLGPNIRAGAHYTQFIVMDFDGDGRAELAVKTAPGTRDGTGAYLSSGPAASDDDSAVFRNGAGYILTGPEYLTVFDGESGAELATVDFDQARGNVEAWGDDYGNRVDRFLATAAYLDDTGLPSFVMARGYYTRTTLTAWNWRDGNLTRIWKFDSNDTPRDSNGNDYTGQGAHSLSVANVDDDPQQEIVYGAMTVDHDGTGMCSTGLNHGDALHATDLLPDRPGIEVFMPHEYDARPLWSVRDGATCEIVAAGAVSDADVGRGVAADIFPGNPGAELWASNGVPLSSVETGQGVGGAAPSAINFLIWWDADESRELEDGTTISKFGGGSLLSCSACSSNNGTKSTPTLTADLFGDWREEVVWRESNNSALRIYTTTDVTARRIYTLMHDAQYRVAVSWQNVAYNQPPHPSFHIGDGMADPPAPDIRLE